MAYARRLGDWRAIDRRAICGEKQGSSHGLSRIILLVECCASVFHKGCPGRKLALQGVFNTHMPQFILLVVLRPLRDGVKPFGVYYLWCMTVALKSPIEHCYGWRGQSAVRHRPTSDQHIACRLPLLLFVSNLCYRCVVGTSRCLV